MSTKRRNGTAVTLTAKALRARDETNSQMAVRHSEMAGLRDYFCETDEELWESGSAKASSAGTA